MKLDNGFLSFHRDIYMNAISSLCKLALVSTLFIITNAFFDNKLSCTLVVVCRVLIGFSTNWYSLINAFSFNVDLNSIPYCMV